MFKRHEQMIQIVVENPIQLNLDLKLPLGQTNRYYMLEITGGFI